MSLFPPPTPPPIGCAAVVVVVVVVEAPFAKRKANPEKELSTLGASIVRGSPIYGDYLQSVKFIFPVVPYRPTRPLSCIPHCSLSRFLPRFVSRMKRGWLVWRSPKHGRLVSTHANNNYSPGLTRKAGLAATQGRKDIDIVSIKAEISRPVVPCISQLPVAPVLFLHSTSPATAKTRSPDEICASRSGARCAHTSKNQTARRSISFTRRNVENSTRTSPDTAFLKTEQRINVGPRAYKRS